MQLVAERERVGIAVRDKEALEKQLEEIREKHNSHTEQLSSEHRTQLARCVFVLPVASNSLGMGC